jgi:RNA polymerase sigma factor (sigma-70 family)
MAELRDWVLQARQGDLESYGKIVRRFQDMAYGYAYSLLSDFHLAEDAAQEAFIEAFRELADLRTPEAFPGWFRKIVFKQCDRIRRRKRPQVLSREAEGRLPSREPEPGDIAAKKEMAESVLRAIQALPEPERTVTTLFYINGYSQKDIADFLEVPATTVNNRLHTSRKRLKERTMNMVADELQNAKLGPEFAANLFNGINLEKWAILSKTPQYEVTNGELVIGHGGLHAEVGGMSWDDYRAGLEVLVEREDSPGKRTWSVQLCPRGTCVFCQLMTGCVVIAYQDKEKGFTHLRTAHVATPAQVWHRFEILVQEGGVVAFLNGKEVARSQVPRGTSGNLGLLVCIESDARVRLRRLQITFLKPTPQQLKELEKDAWTNWEDFKRREIAAGRRKSLKDDSLEGE